MLWILQWNAYAGSVYLLLLPCTVMQLTL